MSAYDRSRQHIAFRSRDHPVAGAPDPPEVGILIEAQSAYRRPRWQPPPWDRIAPGERIWVLYESDIVATAVVDRVIQLEDCSAEDLRELAVGYRLHQAEDYWRNLSRGGLFGRLSAVVIWTRDERWREAPLKRLVRFKGRHSGLKSWIVVNQLDDLAEVDALPESDAPSGVSGEGAVLDHGEPLANMFAIAGMLLFMAVVAVAVVVFLIWSLLG